MKLRADYIRTAIWHHNALRGHVAMGQKHMADIAGSRTCTAQAQALANTIAGQLAELEQLLHERYDEPEAFASSGEHSE
ncbi:hypothetical protein M0Q28_06140 [Patescibacteria group bacterium]|jgi:hypothetical protein|nr:hypothetical protein [Patescibacteria group bacterium]